MGDLNQMSFCFTGAMEKHLRTELWEMVTKHNGIVHKSLLKNTNFLVMANPNSDSIKAKRAKTFGTILISEDDFYGMCGTSEL